MDLSVLAEAGLFDDAFSAASSVASTSGNNNNGNISPVRVFGSSTLNRFMELDRPIWTAFCLYLRHVQTCCCIESLESLELPRGSRVTGKG